jgi:hypothetical protein
MRSGRSNRVRTIALALAIGVNASFLLLLLFSHGSKVQEPVAATMIWIVASLEPRPPARRTVPKRASRGAPPATSSIAAPTAALIETPPQPVTDSAATGSAQSIDWYAEAAIVARDMQPGAGQPRPGAPPEPSTEVRVRPESFWIPPKKGTVEKMEGGGSRVWTSDLCYREYNPLDPDPFTGRFRNGGKTVCKSRNSAERQSEARAEAIADAVRRKRSGAAQPAPEPAGSRVQVP